MNSMRGYTIDDNLNGIGAVEVTVEFFGGEKRWCFFITPESLRAVGDWVPGTEVRHHIGERHMIVLEKISEPLIDIVLNDLDRQGLLMRHTDAVE